MKFKSIVPIVAGLVILQSCSTPKNDVLWVGGIKSECDAGAGNSECLKVFKGDALKDEKWENFHSNIEGFEFEEGYLKKIEVKTEKQDAKDVPADASSVKYTLIKELDRKEDPRIHLDGNWVLATINGGNINKMVVLPTLNFNLNTMMMSGNSGCNLYSAEIVGLSTSEIEISEVPTTLKACANENIERDYHKALSEVKGFKVEDDVLALANEKGDVVLSFIKVNVSKAKNALLGEWNNTRINGKEINTESIPTLVFDLEKMMVGGKDGCNSYGAELRNFTETDLLLSQISSTKMMCPDMEIPDQFLNAFTTVVTYKIEGEELILFDKDGKEVLAFSK